MSDVGDSGPVSEGGALVPQAPQEEEGTWRGTGLQVTPSFHTSDAISRPDFVMVGVRGPTGGVILFASTTLTQAELRKKTEGFDVVPISEGPNPRVARLPVQRITVTAEMKDFTMIHADSYPEAVASLQDLWSRSARPSPMNALPSGQ